MSPNTYDLLDHQQNGSIGKKIHFELFLCLEEISQNSLYVLVYYFANMSNVCAWIWPSFESAEIGLDSFANLGQIMYASVD